jgi:hypothetical protein
LPGVLRYKGETYTIVKRGQIEHSKRVPDFKWQRPFLREDLLEQPNFQGTSISWCLSIFDDGTLGAMLSWYSKSDKIRKGAAPDRLLATLRKVLLLETCTHIGDAPVQMALEGNILHAPVWQPDSSIKITSKLHELHVIRVGRAADQLCFTLASVSWSQTVVIGRGACFACCLELCRNSRARVLLL